MNRIFHPYWKWEDFQHGLFDLEREYSEPEEMVLSNQAKTLLTDSKLFYQIGLKVIRAWTFAAEQNLTNSSRNKQAWIGQASCCYYYKIPERITKLGWRLMSIPQQVEANKVADKIIRIWEKEHAKKLFKQECLESF